MNRPDDRHDHDPLGRRSHEEILGELAGTAHTVPLTLLHAILSHYCEALLFARRAGLSRPFDAEVELDLLHAREQSRLLREAAEITLAFTLEGRLLTAPLAPLPRVADWSARWAAEIDRAVRDRVPVEGTLLACGLSEPRGWPTPLELIRGACRLDSIRLNRLGRARILFAAGRRDEARIGYERLAAELLPVSRRVQLHEAQGIACEAALDLPRALDHYERAAALGSGARAFLAAGIVALELSQEDHVQRAVERLEEQRLAPAPLQRLWREAVERRALLGRPWDGRLDRRVQEILTACAARPLGGLFA